MRKVSVESDEGGEGEQSLKGGSTKLLLPIYDSPCSYIINIVLYSIQDKHKLLRRVLHINVGSNKKIIIKKEF